MDQYSSDTGNLNVIVTGTDSYSPLSSATIEIANTGEPNRILESVNTDRNGQTGNIELSAPPREYSMEPTDNQPYSEYNVKISAPGYQEGLLLPGASCRPDILWRKRIAVHRIAAIRADTRLCL